MSVTPTEAALFEAVAARVIGADKGAHILPFYIGGYIDALLMGGVLSQLFSYWRFIRKDKKHIVGLVLLSSAATIAATIVNLIWLMRLFVWAFGLYLPFTETLYITPTVSIEITSILLVHIFYIDRACRLYTKPWPAFVVGPLALATAVVGSVMISYLGKVNNITPELLEFPRNEALAYSWMGLTLATDFFITVIVVYGLYTIQTGFKHTDSRLRKLIIVSFEAQVPALIVAIAFLASWNNQNAEVAVCFMMFTSKVYVLGLLVTLNVRTVDTVSAAQLSGQSISMNRPAQISYTMETYSHDQPDVPSDQNKHDWQFSPSANRDRPTDAEMGHHDNASDVVDEKEYGSTTGLNDVNKKGRA